MLKRYMHKRERRLAMLNDNRVVRPFEWGTEFIGKDAEAEDPHELFKEFSRETIENSDQYFSIPTIADFTLSDPPAVAVGWPVGNDSPSTGRRQPPATAGGSDHAIPPGFHTLTWPSAVTTPSPENNTAYATYFPHEDRRAAVIVLPHWNAKAGTYFDLCRFFNKVGHSALRLTLPYHEERMPAERERADSLVAPNVGRSLQSIRQSVADTRACVAWLKLQGYEKIGIVGTSIGSCVAFLAFVHDPAIDAAVFNHVSGYMADVVWHGLSTYHVRDGFGDNIDLDELREYWLPVSPMAYMEKLAAQGSRPQRYIYTLYDLSFPVELSRETMRALRRHKIKHSKAAIPCGHYTLGEKPWVYLDGYKIIRFLHKNLR
jgi:pimeloyl-ACP methyl ester carboxylesterase